MGITAKLGLNNRLKCLQLGISSGLKNIHATPFPNCVISKNRCLDALSSLDEFFYQTIEIGIFSKCPLQVHLACSIYKSFKTPLFCTLLNDSYFYFCFAAIAVEMLQTTIFSISVLVAVSEDSNLFCFIAFYTFCLDWRWFLNINRKEVFCQYLHIKIKIVRNGPILLWGICEKEIRNFC